MPPRRSSTIRRTQSRTRLARARKEAVISQEELADAAGISRATLQRLEAGRVDDPGVRTLARCASALRCELSDILEPEWLK